MQQQHNLIAVMGVTGAGKSYFINHTSKIQQVKIGDGLQSCTSDIEEATFMLGNTKVTLVDTPGFDDTNKSDTEILQIVSEWMAQSYEKGLKLRGIIYLHRIMDPRMAGSAVKNLNMFKKLCGEDCYQNVILMTSRWDAVSEEVGRSREKELGETFWKPMLLKKSKMLRYTNDEDGIKAVREILRLPEVVLTIQHEIVDEGKKLIETAAGGELQQEIEKATAKYRKEIEDLKVSFADAQRDRDREMQEFIRQEQEKTSKVLEKIEEQRRRLEQDNRKMAKKVAKAQEVKPVQKSAEQPQQPIYHQPYPPSGPQQQQQPAKNNTDIGDVILAGVEMFIPPVGKVLKVIFGK